MQETGGVAVHHHRERRQSGRTCAQLRSSWNASSQLATRARA